MSQRAFLFDVNRCTGCQACEVACAIENQLTDVSWRQVVTYNEERRPGAPTMHLSLACNHCAEPPCMAACPALAYTKDRLTGRVDLDAERCIGCGYCSWACPYDAPSFDRQAGVMTKCTFCGERQAAGLEPACVEQCPTGALGFGDLTELPGSADGVGMPTLRPRPSIRFMPWSGSARGPSAFDTKPQETPVAAADPSKISLRSEWPLVVFSLIATILVGSQTASLFGATGLPAWAFFGLAAVGMGASTAHLGRPQRAWRALLNVRHSWLSREIALFSAFMAAAAGSHLGRTPVWWPGVTVGLGMAALFAVDRVYDVARPPESRRLHSADVVVTAVPIVALFLREPWLLGLMGLAKLSLYLYRKLQRRKRELDPRWRWSGVRIGVGLGLIAWVTLWGAEAPGGLWLAAGLVMLFGESIDRGEFYNELEVPTPRHQMHRELAGQLGGA